MNSKSKAERLLVFIVYRAVFTDGLARVRKPSKIKAIVQAHWPSCESSVGGYGIGKVVDILRDLLRAGVFESEAQARKEFPELFRNFLPDGFRPITFADGVAQVKVGTTERQPSSEHTEETEQSTIIQLDGSSKSVSASTEILEESESDHLSRPCPLPKYIQHRILTNTQSLLETCCFDFATQWLPTVLLENGWDCAVACELQRWIRVLKSHVAQLPNNTFCSANTQSLENMARSIPRLRHTAVHRLSLTTNEFLQLLTSAVELTVVLRDEVRTEKLRKLYNEIKTQIDLTDQSKKRIRDTVRPQLRRIQGMRTGLANREKYLLSETKQKEKQADDLAVKKLEDLILEVFSDQSQGERVNR